MWDRTYLKEFWPKGVDDTTRDRRIVEAIISLHRMRGERFVDNRHFYLLRNPLEDTEEGVAVAIGFADEQTEWMLDRCNAWRIPDEVLSIVRGVIGI